MKPTLKKIHLMRLRAVVIIGLVSLLASLTGCSMNKVFTTNSAPPPREIVIDGRPDDWLGELSYLEDEKILLGILNDKDSLYLCFQAADRFRQIQILNGGLTVWFDPQGGHEKKYGIRFPLGMKLEEMLPLIEAGEAAGEEALPPDFPPQALRFLGIIKSAKGPLVMTADGPQRPPQTIDLQKERSIEADASPWGGGIVIEFKIPLAASPDRPFAINAQPGASLAVGLETSQLSFGRRQGMPMGGGMPGGGMQPQMGGMPGEMGGYGMRPNLPKPLSFWAEVRLSQAP